MGWGVTVNGDGVSFWVDGNALDRGGSGTILRIYAVSLMANLLCTIKRTADAKPEW